MQNHEIKVQVVNYGRANLMLRYTDPVTGKHVSRSAGTAVKKDAEREAGKWEAELREGRYKPPTRVTWKEFRKRYEDEVVAGLADKTAKKSAAVFNAVEKHINPARATSMTAEQISVFQRKMRDAGLTENSIKSHLGHLRAALRWACRVGIIYHVPTIDMPKRTKTARHRPITGEEYERMLTAVEKTVGVPQAQSWRDLLTGLWWSGLRIAEALNLTWDREDLLCIDLTGKRPMLRIPAERQKNHKNTTLPIAPEFAELLLKTPEAKRHGYVFDPRPRNEKRNHRLTEQQVIRTVAEFGRKAKVKVGEKKAKGEDGKPEAEHATAHDFRRAFGTRWSKRVMPAVLKQLMRHASINTTMAYYVDEDAQDTAEVLYLALGNTSGNTAPHTEKVEEQQKTAKPETATDLR